MTLLEVLICIGLLSLVGGFSLYFSMDDTRAYSFRDDRDKIVSVLQRARTESMHGVCRESGCVAALPHGVYRNENILVLFEGASYAARSETFDENIELRNGALTLSGAEEIIFAPISGRVTTFLQNEWSIHITDGLGKESVITTNAEGRIFWSN